MNRIWKEIPQIDEIEDGALREKVKACFEEAIVRAGWTENDAPQIPFTLLIADCPVSLLSHTSSVAAIAMNSATELERMFNGFHFNRDYLIAGAILHDVGKFLEYAKSADGKVMKSKMGKYLRHPFSGAALAYEMRLPDEVVHIIAVHAHEGDAGYRSIEAILVNKADFITFDTLRKFLEG